MQKITKAMLKTLKTVYLYSNGVAVGVHNTVAADGVPYRFVDAWEKFVPDDCYLDFTGRLIFGSIYQFAPGISPLCQTATRIRAKRPSLDNGSEATRERCLQVGSLEIVGDSFSVYLHELPGLISSEYTYQPDTTDNGEEVLRKIQEDRLYHWAGEHVRKIYRTKD